VAPTLLEGDGSAPFAVVVAVDNEEASGAEARSRLEADLLRIATELRADRVVPGSGHVPDAEHSPALSRLTAKEWEILVRLMDGHRVPSIAADMFISQSTVRHHLSSIFAKVGVHSQDELIRLLRAR